MKYVNVWFVFGLVMAAAACQHGTKQEMPPQHSDSTVSDLHSLLKATPSGPLLPELMRELPTQWAATPTGQSLLAWGREAASVTTIPETTYTKYRRFRIAGERGPYEGPYFEKRTLLTREVIAAWLDQSDVRMDRINDLVWSICEEMTWVAPAHEKAEWNIDLFSAETGADLAHVLLLLGDRLPDEVRKRVRAEIKRRIMNPYLVYGRQYWWNAGSNNWTGVCAGSVGQTFLLLEDDAARLAEALALVLEQLDRFIEHAFEDDGGCLEGIGYWNYGLIHYVGFAEMLRERTRGAIDLLAADKIKAVARYPLAAYLGNGLYASFSDAHEHASLEPFLAARLADRTDVQSMRGLIGGGTGWRLTSVLRNLIWWDGKTLDSPPLEDCLLPQSGLARLVGTMQQKPVALAVKAGHNGEPHNHNDVGSFVLAVDGVVYLCDPGGGLYNAAYFSSKRYDNVFANSYGHSVPRIGGHLQGTGAARRGTLEKAGEKGVRIRYEQAYEAPSLREATRTLSLRDGVMTVEDAFQFEGAGLEIEEAFLTWLTVETDGAIARIRSDKGVLEVRADQGIFTAERLEEACKANHKPGVLTRIAIKYPAAMQVTAKVTVELPRIQ